MREQVSRYISGQIPLEMLDEEDLREVIELLMDSILTQKRASSPASVFKQHDTIQ